jgi:hypothetical protein
MMRAGHTGGDMNEWPADLRVREFHRPRRHPRDTGQRKDDMTKSAEAKKLSIKTLHSDPDNPRTITSKALDGLRVSTTKFGDLSGIVYNNLSGQVVAGHQRLKVLRRAGAKEWTRESDTEGYITHPETGERFNIRIVEWDDVTERAANLTANNPEIAGEYTDEAIDQIRGLETELAEFQELAFGDLAAQLEKDLRKASRKLQDDESGAEDESGEVTDAFMVIIECKSEQHQREMIERFDKEGLKCRALT